MTHEVFSAFSRRLRGSEAPGSTRLSIALQHPPTRLAACWIAGLFAVAVLYWHLTTCARSGCQTLGCLSWLVHALIVVGRTIDRFLMAWGWHVVAGIASLVVTTVFLIKRAPARHFLLVAISASAMGLASILCMIEKRPGVGAGLALGAAILLLVGGFHRKQGCEAAREWPLWIPLGVGGLLRFWSLAEYPRGFAQHAVIHHQGALVFYEGTVQALRSFDLSLAFGLWSLMEKQWGPMSMVNGVGFLVFGVGWVQAQLTQAALGCLAICAAYALGSTLGGRRLGFVFSFLLAVSPWHLAFSRYGDAEHVLPTLQALLAVLFVVRAARWGRILDYVLAGITVGMSWYVYATNQVVPILAAGFLISKLIFSRGFLRRDGVKLLYMAAVFVVMSAPHITALGYGDGLWLLRTPAGELDRNAVVDLDAWREVARQLYCQVWESWFFREGGGLGPLIQSLVIIGASLCIAGLFERRRRDASVLLLLWLALSFLPAVLSATVQFRRLLLTLLVALILASVAILRTLRLFEAGGVSKRASRLILIGLCGLGSAASCFVYFDEVRVEECNLHRYHTEIADFVSKNIGQAYIYAYAPTGTDQWELGYYISLFAYERLQELGREGLSQSQLVAVVERKDLPVVLRDPQNIDGNVQFIASKDAVGEWEDPAGLRSRLARVNLAPRRHGDVFIWEWRVNTGPRSSHRIAAAEQTTGSPREPGSDRERGPSEGED